MPKHLDSFEIEWWVGLNLEQRTNFPSFPHTYLYPKKYIQQVFNMVKLPEQRKYGGVGDTSGFKNSSTIYIFLIKSFELMQTVFPAFFNFALDWKLGYFPSCCHFHAKSLCQIWNSNTMQLYYHRVNLSFVLLSRWGQEFVELVGY